MFQINKTLISEELISKYFKCNLSACQGACCVEGEAELHSKRMNKNAGR